MKKKNAKTLVIFIAALIFLAVSVFLFRQNADYKKNGKIAEATITRIEGYYSGDDYEHDVYVQFTAGDALIEGRLNVYKSSFYEGKVIEVIYKPDNPHNFIYRGYNNVLPFICLVAGLIILCFAVEPVIRNVVTLRKISRLKEIGKTSRGVIKKIEYNQKLSIGGKCIALVSVIDDSGMLYEKKMSLTPGEIKEGDGVTVYVNIENADDFAFDFQK